jgi:hypothetical protein
MSNVLTTTEMLATLNTMRVARNQPPLKSWKGSRAALEQTITAYRTRKVEPAIAEGAYPTSTKAEASTELKGTHAKKRQAIAKANKFKAEPAPKRKTTKEQTINAKADSGLISLADIARELDIAPKLARAKARRSTDISKLATGDAWAFTPDNAKKVKAILKG